VADHDAVNNVPVAERLARGSGLAFIRAVEVSCTLGGHTVHVLGYGIDLRDPTLLGVLERNQRQLRSAGEESIHKLIQAGYDIDLQAYEAYQDDATRGGWKALNYLIDLGICRDVKDFFGRLFVGDMALSYPDFAAPDEAVRAIHQAGGTAICAHPGFGTREGGPGLLEELLACGVDGLECYTPYHDPAEIRYHVELCRRHGLLITAGSDCHGGFAGRALGVPPAHVTDLNLGPLFDHVIR
jgi:predicted metal-dependent phosphoesterase TrpH